MGKFPRKVKGWLCPDCEEVSEEDDWMQVEAIRESDLSDLQSYGQDELVSKEEVEKIETLFAYECPCCNVLVEDPEEGELWECVGCLERYDDKEDAYHCCEGAG